ncbi:MAG: hypothetical protein ABIJ81_04565 [Patescibacteria group bacterium]
MFKILGLGAVVLVITALVALITFCFLWRSYYRRGDKDVYEVNIKKNKSRRTIFSSEERDSSQIV